MATTAGMTSVTPAVATPIVSLPPKAAAVAVVIIATADAGIAATAAAARLHQTAKLSGSPGCKNGNSEGLFINLQSPER